MDKSDWAGRLRKEIDETREEARTNAHAAVLCIREGRHEVAGQMALEALRDDARINRLGELLARLHTFRFDSEIDEAYADIDARVDVDTLSAQANVAAWNASETTAIVNTMREPGESLSAHHFQAWSQLDPEERDTWRRIFGDDEKRLGGPCSCDAPAVIREEMGQCGLMKCSVCCAIWDASRAPKNALILERPWERRKRKKAPLYNTIMRAAEPVRADDVVALDVATGDVRPVHPANRYAARALEHERRVADILCYRDPGPLSAFEVVARAGGEKEGWSTLSTVEPDRGPLAGKIIATQINRETGDMRDYVTQR